MIRLGGPLLTDLFIGVAMSSRPTGLTFPAALTGQRDPATGSGTAMRHDYE
jgi:hypothetical protein